MPRRARSRSAGRAPLTYTGRPVRVTTVTGRFKDAGGLIHWAWQCGVDGKDYRTVKGEAATVGTTAHAVIRMIHRGQPDDQIAAHVEAMLPDPEARRKAWQAAESFLTWARGITLTVLDEEVEVSSEALNAVGHIDAVARQGTGRAASLVLLDWKTSGGFYTDYLVQIAAYWGLWNASHGPRDQLAGGHLLRISKDTSDFHHTYVDDLHEPWEQFLRLREAYEIDKRLKKRL